jgi:S1-C subfamily serine protease
MWCGRQRLRIEQFRWTIGRAIESNCSGERDKPHSGGGAEYTANSDRPTGCGTDGAGSCTKFRHASGESGGAPGCHQSATPSIAGDLRSAIRQVAQQVRPAIVQITNLQQQPTQFLGGGATVPSGVGSGVIYDAQGHILTSNHVISGAQQLQVSLPDRRSFPQSWSAPIPRLTLLGRERSRLR